MNQSIAEFHGTSVTLIDHAGQKWLTAEEVGQCLGYAEANARQGVNNLFKRHEDEFSGADTSVIKLMTGSRGEQNSRIFSDTGCIKLGFFANTPRAKEFRTWASKVLAERQIEQPAPAATPLESNMAHLAGDMPVVPGDERLRQTVCRLADLVGAIEDILTLAESDVEELERQLRG